MTPRKNDGLFTWIEIARSISTLFSALFLVLSHLFELIAIACAARSPTDAKPNRKRARTTKSRTSRSPSSSASPPRTSPIGTAHRSPDRQRSRPSSCRSTHIRIQPGACGRRTRPRMAAVPRRRLRRDRTALVRKRDRESPLRGLSLKLDGKLKNPKETLDTFLDAVARSFVLFAQRLPRSAFTMDEDGSEIPPTFHVSLLETLTISPSGSSRVIAPSERRAPPARIVLRSRAPTRRARRQPSSAASPIEEYRGTPRRDDRRLSHGHPAAPALRRDDSLSIKPADRLEHWHLSAHGLGQDADASAHHHA